MSDRRIQWSDRQIAVCAGLDAIRILMGISPVNFTAREIIWMLARAIREVSR